MHLISCSLNLIVVRGVETSVVISKASSVGNFCLLTMDSMHCKLHGL